MLARWLGLVLVAGALDCARAAHVDLKLDLRLGAECVSSAQSNPSPPMSCDQLTLDCADHLLFRVRAVKDGRPADIISSRCLTIETVGRPRDLCAFGALPDPVSLIDSVPSGTTFIFQLAALRLGTMSQSCDDDAHPPLRIFGGYSDPIAIDGEDHTASLHLTTCGSCADLPELPDGGPNDLGPPKDGSTPSPDAGGSDGGTIEDQGPPIGDLATPTCPPGQHESPYYPVGALCCPDHDGNLCRAPGSRCPDGTSALLPPGGCCAVCD